MHWHLMGRGNDAAKHSTMCIPTSMIRTYAAQIVNSTEIKKKKTTMHESHGHFQCVPGFLYCFWYVYAKKSLISICRSYRLVHALFCFCYVSWEGLESATPHEQWTHTVTKSWFLISFSNKKEQGNFGEMTNSKTGARNT